MNDLFHSFALLSTLLVWLIVFHFSILIKLWGLFCRVVSDPMAYFTPIKTTFFLFWPLGRNLENHKEWRALSVLEAKGTTLAKSFEHYLVQIHRKCLQEIWPDLCLNHVNCTNHIFTLIFTLPDGILFTTIHPMKNTKNLTAYYIWSTACHYRFFMFAIRFRLQISFTASCVWLPELDLHYFEPAPLIKIKAVLWGWFSSFQADLDGILF